MWVVIFSKNGNGIYDFKNWNRKNSNSDIIQLFDDWKDAVNFYIENYSNQDFDSYKFLNTNKLKLCSLQSKLNNCFSNEIKINPFHYTKHERLDLDNFKLNLQNEFDTFDLKWKDLSNKTNQFNRKEIDKEICETQNIEFYNFYIDSCEYNVPKYIIFWTKYSDWRFQIKKRNHFIIKHYDLKKPCNAIRLKLAALIHVIEYCFRNQISKICIFTRSRFFDQIMNIWFQNIYSHNSDCDHHRDLYHMFFKNVYKSQNPIFIKSELNTEHFSKSIYKNIPARIFSPFYHLIQKIENKPSKTTQRPRWSRKDLL